MNKLFLILVLILASKALTQPYYEIGSPFVRTFSPDEYNANNQNWAIIQDSRGIVYVANTNGLLEYNGAEWALLQTSVNSSVRALAYSNDSILYVGGNGDLGFVGVNKNFKTQFVSLLNKLPENDREFGRISAIYSTDYGVYFFTKDKIFIYKDNNFKVIKFSINAQYAAKIYNLLFVISKSGIYYCEGENFIKLPESEKILHEAGRVLLTEFENNRMLIVTEKKGFFVYDLKPFYDSVKKKYNFNISRANWKKFEIESYEYFKENEIYVVKKIASNLYGIGTSFGGLVIIDSLGKIKQVLKKSNGLLDNSVTDIFVDNLNNLWLTHLKGISYVYFNTKLFYFGEQEGLEGAVYRVVRFQNSIYAATPHGLFVLNKNEINEPNVNKFTFIEETKERIWDIFPYQNYIFAISSSFLGIVQNNKLIQKQSLDGYCVFITDSIPNVLWIGTSDGLEYATFRQKGKLFEFSKITKVPNIKTPVRRIKYWNGYLWLATSYDGIFRLKVINLDENRFEIVKYDKTNGLARQEQCVPVIYNNQLYICSASGLYLPDNDKVKKVNLFNSPVFDSLKYNFLVKAKDKTFISTTEFDFGWVDYNKETKSLYFNNVLGEKIKKFRIYDLYVDSNDSSLWFSTNKGILRYDIVQKQDYSKKYSTYLVKIVFGRDSLYFNGAFYEPNSLKDSIYTKISKFQQSKNLELPYSLNKVTFYFASNCYENPENIEYSCLLDGFEKSWTNWSKSNYKEYSFLHEGSYVFKVKAKNVFKNESETFYFQFSIKPPWYRTIYAYIGYAIGAIIFIYILIYINSLRLKRENKRLEEIIAQRTAEIVQKNAMLQQQNEEIKAQAEALRALNLELEKLAVAVRETDNSIIIMDKDGNLEWANRAFEKIYGMDLSTFKEKYGKTIYEVSSNSQIAKFVEECKKNKISLSYDSEFYGVNGKIWLQTTLTPVLDFNKEVSKIIAVETNITKIKEFEMELLEKNNLLAEQNEYIKAGIRYAKNLQQAILPLTNSFPSYVDAFVLYLPKDIVSGDLYWYSRNHLNGQIYDYFAVVDCTGHGVPGAFMSLIAHRLLTETIINEKLHDTNIILDKIAEKLSNVLQQRDTNTSDGMDIILIRISKLENKYAIQFSGAKRPLLLYRANAAEVDVFKTDRWSIGMSLSHNNLKFTSFEVVCETNDIIYLYSDGFIDQVNANGRKIGTLKLIEMLKALSIESMAQHHEYLLKVFYEHMGKEIQRDDVTILGLKFK